MSIGGRFGSGGGAAIDLVGVLHELLPRDYGGLSRPEFDREHLPVTGLDERRRSPRRIAAAALLFLHRVGGGERILGREILGYRVGNRRFANQDASDIGEGNKGRSPRKTKLIIMSRERERPKEERKMGGEKIARD